MSTPEIQSRWSLDESDYSFESLDDAIKAILYETTLSEAQGRFVYRLEFRKYDPATAFDSLLDAANDRAEEDSGYDGAETLFDTIGADADELSEFVADWARRNAKEIRYVPAGKATRIEITAEDLAEYADQDEGGAA